MEVPTLSNLVGLLLGQYTDTAQMLYWGQLIKKKKV